MNQLAEIFAFWQQCAKHPRARMDDAREKAITKALRWGYSVDDLKLAIFGCCSNPWYAEGRNDRGTVFTALTLILRDGDHIDRFYADGERAVLRDWTSAAADDDRRTTERTRVREIPAEARGKITRLFRGG